jgi:hypothetical protein
LLLRIEQNDDGEDRAEGYEGFVQLFDAYGRVVYEGTGVAQCKSN